MAPRAGASPTARESRYWALAEMVRMRAGIAEDEPHDAQRGEARARASQSGIPDPDERALDRAPTRASSGPRASARRRTSEDLFAAWRTLLRADGRGRRRSILVFEDMHWADAALLDFIEYLAGLVARPPDLHPHARRGPELLERRPDVGRGQAQLHVGRPRAAARGGHGGAAARARARAARTSCGRRIVERAEGVPLYAVETVRMLLDRGAARPARRARTADQRTSRRRSTVPETLHALIAARLDGTRARRARTFSRTRRSWVERSRQHGLQRSLPGSRSRACPAALPRSCGRRSLIGRDRSALARARAVRLPPGARAEGRLRHALVEGTARRAISQPPRTSRPPGTPRKYRR